MNSKAVNRWLSLGMAWLPVVVFGVEYLSALGQEWWLNEQYSYGFVVPILAVYLVALRWGERPNPVVPGLQKLRMLPAILWVGLAAVWFPLRLVLIANPDWRSAMWAMALLCVGGILLQTLLRGGWGWVWHFLGPILLLLLAVPWPGDIEQPLVQSLMRVVAGMTVEVLNLAGVYAEQSGNLIRLSTGLVGVEEACSGVRSLQSTLMAAVFLGCLYRFPAWMRLGLIAMGLLLSLLLNIARTLTLTALTIRSGPQYMEQIHDPLGHAVAIVAFLLLLACAFLFARWRGNATPAALHAPEGTKPIAGWFGGVSFLTVWIAGMLLSHAWFSIHEAPVDNRLRTELAWSKLGYEIDFPPFPSGVKGMLRYSEGLHARWKARSGAEWTVFAFSWDRGTISSFAGVHRPEVCLPSAGLSKVADAPPLLWEYTQKKINFSVGVYALDRWPVHVFYGLWSSAQDAAIPLATTAGERIAQAFAGQRVQDRHVLQIVLVGSSDIETSRREVQAFLDQAVQITTVR
ncbi:MAG: exosortase/archaeosortase family protein [Verrucomicrobiota bacterium]|nr:exosortase/archaeosortase family protein [Verrucomicrobiota bacterium]